MNSGAIKTFRTRFFYNSAVQPDRVDVALACSFKRNTKKSGETVVIESRVFRASTRISDDHIGLEDQSKALSNCNNADISKMERTNNNVVKSRLLAASGSSIGVHHLGITSRPCSVNTDIEPCPRVTQPRLDMLVV